MCISLICARLQSARENAETNASQARELERQILELTDAEQRRIGSDLHDGLGQHLTGITMMLGRHQQDLESAGSPTAATAQKVLDLAQTALEWTHDLSKSLSPPALESAGLEEALRDLAHRAENLFSIECTFENRGKYDSPDLAAGFHLYRIAQEAISNAVRHGKAKHVQVRLHGSGPAVLLEIIDDGSGFEQSEKSKEGMGLRIMTYRAKMIGAEMDVRSHGGGGTIVRCQYSQGR